MEYDIHRINTTFVPYAVVDLGPTMSEGGVIGTKRENVFAHVLVQLGFYENGYFQAAPTHPKW
jgi:hypothetical protein